MNGNKVGVIRVTSGKFSSLTKGKEYDVYESSVGNYYTHYDNGTATYFPFGCGNILKEDVAEWVKKPSNNTPLEPVEVSKAILDGEKLEFYDLLDDSWEPVEHPKDISVGYIKSVKLRIAKSIEDKRKEVIKKLLADKVAVLCKCWDCDERLATIQAVTGVQVGSYPYITDNDRYGYGYAIDNRGNEITEVSDE